MFFSLWLPGHVTLPDLWLAGRLGMMHSKYFLLPVQEFPQKQDPSLLNIKFVNARNPEILSLASECEFEVARVGFESCSEASVRKLHHVAGPGAAGL